MVRDNDVLVNKMVNKRMLQFKLTTCIYQFVVKGSENVGVDQAIFVTCDDITKDLQVHLFDKMNQFKMKIIASISHKFKTPLNCALNLIKEL